MFSDKYRFPAPEKADRLSALWETLPAILFCLFVLTSVLALVFWLVVISPQEGSIKT